MTDRAWRFTGLRGKNNTSLSFPLQTSLCGAFVRLLYLHCSLSVNLYVYVIYIAIYLILCVSSQLALRRLRSFFLPIFGT